MVQGDHDSDSDGLDGCIVSRSLRSDFSHTSLLLGTKSRAVERSL